MEKNIQNVIIKLNWLSLNKYIRNEDKYNNLLGYEGMLDNGGSYLTDEIILHRFGELRGTYKALCLLGKILDGIDDSLNFIYYFEYKNQQYKADGFIINNEIVIDFVNPLDGNRKILDVEFEIIDNIIRNNEKEILIEYNKMTKYYKEYYTRLFDRGRTIK